VLLVGVGLYIADYYNLLPRRAYTAGDFNIATVYSEVDYNDNGIDDYTDILLGAKLDAENCPTYNGAYYGGGYPPDDIGVCTDVVWRAFKNAVLLLSVVFLLYSMLLPVLSVVLNI
jgi:hypothetical protein